MSKIVFVDFNIFMFKSIFIYEKHPTTPPTYLSLTMLLGDLTKVGIEERDTIILALDSKKGSWRKEVDPNYKANRKENREKHKVNWNQMFNKFKNLLRQLDLNTPFHVLEADKLEADDIIAYGCRKFEDFDITIISSDSDYEQLCFYPNVKVFSPISKKYKVVTNPHKLLAKKIEKETADNLISPILSEKDWEIRHKIVSLLTLPEEIEEKADKVLSVLPLKDWNISQLPFPSLHSRFKNIYRQDKKVKEKLLTPSKKGVKNGKME